MNLRDKHPAWKLHHEMTEFYGMPNLSPNSFDELSNRMLESEALSKQYVKTWSVDGPDGDNLECD